MTSSPDEPETNDRGPYLMHGAAQIMMECQAPEVLLSGPAGTGKSMACLCKLHSLASLVPDFRGLILRRTRESLTESALVTFEQNILPRNHPALASGGQRRMRQSYRYPNGSEIVVGGLDKPSKIMSTEFDVAYIQEAIEIDEGGWESVTTRLRNGRLPFQQMIADTNPDAPRHWLKRRCDAGRCRLLESRHEDNPRLYRNGQWTADGSTYLSKLDALTGPRLQRLRYGRWVQAEGVVYDGWDAARHLVDRFPIPRDWPRLLSVDFGYVNPFVCQWWAIDPDGRMYRYREIYHTKRLVEDHARQIVELSAGEPQPVCVVCDHDAEDRATLERHLELPTIPANKAVMAGIQAVAERLQGVNGRPRLLFLRDSLVERDAELHEGKKPCSTIDEFDAYIWDERAGPRGDRPIKENDHGMDCCRYAVATYDMEERGDDDVTPSVVRA